VTLSGVVLAAGAAVASAAAGAPVGVAAVGAPQAAIMLDRNASVMDMPKNLREDIEDLLESMQLCFNDGSTFTSLSR